MESAQRGFYALGKCTRFGQIKGEFGAKWQDIVYNQRLLVVSRSLISARSGRFDDAGVRAMMIDVTVAQVDLNLADVYTHMNPLVAGAELVGHSGRSIAVFP